VGEDRSSTALATVRGRHRPLRTGREPRLRPLVLTTLGRSGSTVAMRMLAAHPEVAGGEAFRYGPRVASYWASVFQELSDPGSYPRQIAGGMRRGLNERGWWMRSADHPLMEVPDAYVREWIGVEAVESLAGFVQERIESLYEQIAANEYRPFAEYFVEKYQPNLVPSMMWELYPDAREVVLVRDFRDTLCSILAFNEKRGAVMFGRERTESDEEYVRRTFRKSAMSLMHAWRRRAGRAYLLRYEDLMSDPEATIASVVDYLGVDSSAAALDSMLAMVVERSAQTDVHRTSAGGDASVGRWRADLPVPLQEATQEAIGPALEAFGYDPAPSPA
jgi:hypothetical protein